MEKETSYLHFRETYIMGTKYWYYTHKKVRSAYRSLKTNLPNLFTYQRYLALNIPNTTNTIDGSLLDIRRRPRRIIAYGEI